MKPMPEELAGVRAAPGVAAGPVRHTTEAVTDLGPNDPPADADAEVAKVRSALAEVAELLERRSVVAVSPEIQEILSAQSMIAADPILAERAESAVRSGLPGPHAVTEAFGSFRSMLVEAGGYLAERAADLDDISARVIAILLQLPMPGLPESAEPFVLVARDLAPADTAGLDPSTVLALVTVEGGPTSHTAIIARSLGIPAVVACRGASDVAEGATVVVDGDGGVVIVGPDAALLADVQERKERRAELERSSRGPGRTSDGHPVALMLNVGQEKDLGGATADAEGVGLLRTEFLFLDRVNEPSAEEQEDSYRRVFQAFPGQKVVVRTLDAGADKPVKWLDLGAGQNPALGVRGLRTARRYPEVLARQLDAIARAASGSDADVWVMAPMVSNATEAAAFVAQAHEHGVARAGIMVEVPSAAICADEIAGVVDFFSIGTNDLCQYVAATDRMIGELSDLLDHWQPALLRLVRAVVEGARAAAIPVGVCGESASDPLFALVLAGLGVSSLSMSPTSLAPVRASLAAHSVDECRNLAELALAGGDASLARGAVAKSAHGPLP
jgi:phosphoenolpyruvate-protein phosphotransferase (PTS system enzyme I)